MQDTTRTRIEAYEAQVSYLEDRYVDAVCAMGRRPTYAQQAREREAWLRLCDARARLELARREG